MDRKNFFVAGFVFALLSGFVFFELTMDISSLETFVHSSTVLGALLYIFLLMTSVVLLPFSSLPLLPLAAAIFGVWMAALLNILGWWLGCLIAFGVARFGRGYLEKITSFAAIDRLEKKIPSDISFIGIIFLRMILPVDITSFALGLLKNLSFKMYAVASLLGIIPFAVVWSYAGEELSRGQFVSSGLIVASMAVVIVVLRRMWLKRRV